MDANRFDDFARRLLTATSRRGVLVTLTGGLLAIVPLALDRRESVAKRNTRKGKKKKKKKNKNNQDTLVSPPPPPPPPVVGCTPTCAGNTCGDDGCGGLCGTCGECTQCVGTTCANRPDDSPCGSNGKCLAGVCNALPTCGAYGTLCSEHSQCCGGTCVIPILPSTCYFSDAGEPCRTTTDCYPTLGLTCVGYRCKAG
jgi:hypothetical protein